MRKPPEVVGSSVAWGKSESTAATTPGGRARSLDKRAMLWEMWPLPPQPGFGGIK